MFRVLRSVPKFNSLIVSVRSKHLKPDYTEKNYKVTRGAYNYLQDEHIAHFKQILGEEKVITDNTDLEKYNVDWMGQLRGNSKLVLKPKSTEEVSKILKFCNEQNLAVVPQGGNTGIVGGATPVFDEIVLSTELMNQIIELEEKSGVLTCQAGCVLENLDKFLAEKNLMVPLDLGAKGSCQIGGNVSTNAGGLRLLRYGNLHGNILGLEAVKANGEVLDCLNTMKKHNTGFHLNHLFIGSEGTLGVVTKVAFQCPTRPKSINVAFLGLQSYDKVLKTFQKAKSELGEILSAMEVLDTPTMEFIRDNLNKDSPIGDYPFYLLLETSGSHCEHDVDKLNNFLESALNKHFILNGTIASDPSKIKALWELREGIPSGFKKEGHIFCYDVSLPLEHYFTLVKDVEKHIGDRAKRVFGFGHLGDSNLHLNISCESYSEELKNLLDPFVYERTIGYKGSISAEHGIGFLKSKYLTKAISFESFCLMRELKTIMDPKNILNPYKIFPLS